MTPNQTLLACNEHDSTPARLQQTAAGRMHTLVGDADYLATPERWDAAALLTRAARFAHPRMLDGSLSAFLDSWRTGERAPLAVTSDIDRHDTNALARAVLTVHGELTGPTITTTGGLELAQGDAVILDWDADDLATVAHLRTVDAGMLAQVVAIDVNHRRARIDIPVAYVQLDLDADGPLAAHLSYAY